MKKSKAYQILGVSDKADQNEIKKAFRTLAAKHHPDKNPDNKSSEETFKKINTAYQILTGVEKADDDQIYNNIYNAAYNKNNDYFNEVIANEFFRNFYGPENFKNHRNKPPAEPAYRVVDVIMNLELNFHETVFGGEREIEYDIQEYCIKCGGKGLHYKADKCSSCHGSGYLSASDKDMFCSFMVVCFQCGGSGKATENCAECNGKKYHLKHKKIKVKIPPVGNAQITLSLAKQGNIFNKAVISNLLINLIPQTQHGNFKIMNNNILCTKSIPLDILMYGGDVEIETVTGETKTLHINPKTKTGDVYTLYKNAINGKGEFLVRLDVEYPSLTEELKQAIQMAYKPITTEENNGKTEESS